MKVNVFTAVFFLIFKCYGQDTLIEKNKEVILVKILQVAPREVKYVFPNKINGPIYTENRFEIGLIKYQNGKIDDFRKDTTSYYKVRNSNFPYNVDTIASLGHSYFYKGQRINKSKINFMMMQTSKPDQLRINKYSLRAHNLDEIGYATAIGTAALGAISYVSFYARGVAALLGSNNPEIFLKVSGFCFAGAFVTLNTTFICKGLRNKNTHKAIKYFNNSF